MLVDFFSTHTKICEGDTLYHSPPKQQTQVVAPYKPPSEYHHVERNFLMSNCCKGQQREASMEMNNLTEVNLATRENVSK